jgi:hypothetical protein
MKFLQCSSILLQPVFLVGQLTDLRLGGVELHSWEGVDAVKYDQNLGEI